MDKKSVEICISGCDDRTTFTMDLTDTEIALLERVEDAAQEASNYGCQPVIVLEVKESGTDG